MKSLERIAPPHSYECSSTRLVTSPVSKPAGFSSRHVHHIRTCVSIPLAGRASVLTCQHNREVSGDSYTTQDPCPLYSYNRMMKCPLAPVLGNMRSYYKGYRQAHCSTCQNMQNCISPKSAPLISSNL